MTFSGAAHGGREDDDFQSFEIALGSRGADPDKIALLDIRQMGRNHGLVLRLGIQRQLGRLPVI